MLQRISIKTIAVVLISVLGVGTALAAATTKNLSTNYTLINFGSSTANVNVSYYKDDGSAWTASPSSTTFTVTASGGQAIIAQYFDATMTAGRGSAVVASDQPLGAVAQVLARSPQVPTQGAYIGATSTNSTFYVPLVIRRLGGGGGVGTNSQIMVQNADTTSITVTISLVKSATSPGSNYTKSNIVIGQGATYYYDLDDESSANVADGWIGSAVVTASSGRQIAVVSNLFSGADQLQTFNGFPASNLGTTWLVPLFASKLANGLNAPITVQNLSGSPMGVGTIGLSCKKDPASPGTDFTTSNSASVANNESTFFNPVNDANGPGGGAYPTGWFGACTVTAPGNVVSFVQLRTLGTSNAAAYEAINGNGTNTRVLVPLAAKRLTNGFATPITIQNLSSSITATVNLTYVPNPACGGCTTVNVNGLTIPPGASLIRNLRLTAGEPTLPDNWFGTLTVQSTGPAIDGFVQLTTIGATIGDTIMAHGVFTQP